MIGAILKGIAGFFGNGIGQTIGASVSNVALIAALTPAVIWLVASKDDVAVTLTYGELAVFGGILFAVVSIARATRFGSRGERGNDSLDFTGR